MCWKSQIWSPWNEKKQALQLQMAPPVPNMFLSKIQRLMYLAEFGLWIIGAVILSNDTPEIYSGQIKNWSKSSSVESQNNQHSEIPLSVPCLYTVSSFCVYRRLKCDSANNIWCTWSTKSIRLISRIAVCKKTNHLRTSLGQKNLLLLMEEILHHMGWLTPCK